MSENTFYRKVERFFYNGVVQHNNYGKLHYGVIPSEVDCRHYYRFSDKSNYSTLLKDIENNEINAGCLYVDKTLSGKKCLYEASWGECYKHKEKNFEDANYLEKYVAWLPSIEDVVKELSVNELLVWLKDNNMTIKEILDTNQYIIGNQQ